MIDTLHRRAAKSCQAPSAQLLNRPARSARATRKRNELPSMSIRSVETDRSMIVEDETAQHPTPHAEVVVKGRNVEIPDHFRIYVSEKLSRLERFDRTIYLFDVELDHERNRRQRKNCQHVEITARGRGPVVRGEACADSFYAALEVRRLQTGEPAAAQQGPPQGALRRQDSGVAGPGHRRSRRPTPSLPPPSADDSRRTPTTASSSTSPARSCAPRNTRPSR